MKPVQRYLLLMLSALAAVAGAGGLAAAPVRLGHLSSGTAVTAAWSVSSIEGNSGRVRVGLHDARGRKLHFVFSLENGETGAFDRDGVRIFYERTEIASAEVLDVGEKLVSALAAATKNAGGIQHAVATFSSPTRPPADSVGAVTAPLSLRAGDELLEGWKIEAVFVERERIRVQTKSAGGEIVVFGLADAAHAKGPFDRAGIAIYYERTDVAWTFIEPVGNALARRVADVSNGDATAALRAAVATAAAELPPQVLFPLSQLEGRWTVTVDEWTASGGLPRTIGRTSSVRVLTTDGGIHERTTAGESSLSFDAMTRVYLWSWTDPLSGKALQAEGFAHDVEKALIFEKIQGEAFARIALRVVSPRRHVIEFYEATREGARLVRSITYESDKKSR
jgi:hypothetical protein